MPVISPASREAEASPKATAAKGITEAATSARRIRASRGETVVHACPGGGAKGTSTMRIYRPAPESDGHEVDAAGGTARLALGSGRSMGLDRLLQRGPIAG
jgi:hypothetical protein